MATNTETEFRRGSSVAFRKTSDFQDAGFRIRSGRIPTLNNKGLQRAE